MHADYLDILQRITDKPQWWDEHGVPRYNRFRPEDSPNVYTEECALVVVECAVCRREFKGEVNGGVWRGTTVLASMVQEGDVEYGSPPRHTCTGDAVGAHTVRVLEFWRRCAAVMVWERVPGLEVEVLGAGGEEGEDTTEALERRRKGADRN